VGKEGEMKRFIFLAVGVFLLSLFSQNVYAVTIKFDPNDLIDLYPATYGDEDAYGENKATQVNARELYPYPSGPAYTTFYDPANPPTQPDYYNTYLNWRDGLSAGEGIKSFSTVISYIANSEWGAKLVCPDSGTDISAFSDTESKWTVTVSTLSTGNYSISWSATSSDYYLRPGGEDIGEFSFTGDFYWDVDENGYDADDILVEPGDILRTIFIAFPGNLNFDDEGWGTRVPADPAFAGEDAELFYGVLDAQAIPEASTFIMYIMGIFSLFFPFFRRP